MDKIRNREQYVRTSEQKSLKDSFTAEIKNFKIIFFQNRLEGKEHSAQNGGFDHSSTLPSPPSATKPVSSLPSSPATLPPTSIVVKAPASPPRSAPLSPGACSGKNHSLGFPRCSSCCHAADYVVHDCYETANAANDGGKAVAAGDQCLKGSMSPCIPGRVEDR